MTFFGPDGLLATKLEGFEHRPVQEEMARSVGNAFDEGGIALIEAGTGTGKSLAYLVPALERAAEQKRTVISTHTINLQEQLVAKDLPFLIEATGAQVEVVLVKGMSNYLCKRKLEEAEGISGTLTREEATQVDQISEWAEETDEGSRSDLDFVPLRPVWERVGVEYDACSRNRCPHFKQCFLFKARKAAEEAQILVVNHHILLADLAQKAEGEPGILPDYDQLVIDEAHHLESVATDVWAEQVSRSELVRQLGKLVDEKLPTLVRRVKEGPAIKTMRIDLPAAKRRLVNEINDAFFRLPDEDRVRLREPLPVLEKLHEELGRFVASLEALVQELDEEHTLDLKAITRRLDHLAKAIGRFAFERPAVEEVRWIEHRSHNIRLVGARLDIDALLIERLFHKVPSVVLTSATLTAGGSFSFLKKRLGLDGDFAVDEHVFPSPFSFQTQALLAIPTDLPDPKHPAFVTSAADCIEQAIRASEGSAFVLFTSFRMLDQVYTLLAERLADFNLFRQGDEARQKLLKGFRASERAVLFGTDSFWEGVDVVGDALRCVIITKLPFHVPSEPLVQARHEAIEAAGGNSFFDYSVPQAIVKFKQGVGRLIRHKGDRGCVVCLDTRLLSKGYGRTFLASSPPFLQVFESQLSITGKMASFYLENNQKS